MRLKADVEVPVTTAVLGRLARLPVLAAVAMLALGAALGTPTPAAASSGTAWLCLPGHTPDPCTEPLTTTVVQTDGETSIEYAKRAENPPINCFYVYPTVSEQASENANLEIEPQQTQIAIEQASRFSQVCKVYAPVYPQVTLAALDDPPVSAWASIKAYLGVAAAFREFLTKFDEGRGFVLIGHSQGAALLVQLIAISIDPNPVLRRQLVSALLLGGNLLVAQGKLVGGNFQHIPECRTAAETHCAIAYSSFLKEPPQGAYFGRPESPLFGGGEIEGLQVACVNPTLLVQNGGIGPLQPYASTTPFPGQIGAYVEAPTAATPWVAAPGLYTAQCHNENGASWLQVNPVGTPVDPPAYVKESLGPDWGLHLYDIGIALGNLVKTVGLESAAYELESARTQDVTQAPASSLLAPAPSRQAPWRPAAPRLRPRGRRTRRGRR
jgi:hypothetical protein